MIFLFNWVILGFQPLIFQGASCMELIFRLHVRLSDAWKMSEVSCKWVVNPYLKDHPS